MVLFASPAKPFAMTAKLQPRRPVILQVYKGEIDAAYNDQN